MKEVLNMTKALADPSRVRVLMMLKDGELCGCQLIEMLGLAPSTVSKHMSILQQADLVVSRKQGRWIYYRLPKRDAASGIKGILRWLRTQLADNEQILQDRERLETVRCTPKQELCEHYKS